VADSCACIPGRGTLYGARRLEHHARSITQNWKQQAHYLKIDIQNFFVSIHKPTLLALLAQRIPEPWWMWLTRLLLMHDPRIGAIYQSSNKEMALVPPHKRLGEQPSHLGLPIGNLLSQFSANVYLNELDQFIKHRLKAPHYVRYVDDMVLLHESPQWLNEARAAIDAFLRERLALQLNPKKTILQPVARGIDFVGHVLKPWRTTLRKKTLTTALRRLASMDEYDVYQAANSYLGMSRQTTKGHHDRARIANAARRRGMAINHTITKVYA
jgi:hypothetical protein